MNESLVRSNTFYHSLDNRNPPPFTVGNDPIFIRVDVLEELFEFRIRHGNPGFGEGGLQFILIDFPVIVPVDGPKESPQPILSMVDKRAEFWGRLGW